MLDRVIPTESASRIGSWLDLGAHASTRKIQERRLAGYLAGSSHTWTTSGAVDGLVDRVSTATDDLFVAALPALRGASDTVAAAEREDFLDHLAALLGDRPDGDLDILAATMTGFATIDADASRRLEALGLADVHFAPETRWRLVLGADPEALPPTASRMASTLDELYGDPGPDHTGAAGGRVRAGRRGGRGGDRRIGVRRWAGEIEALFGSDQVQEILATAAEKGRAVALLGPDGSSTIDPESVRPSVELLGTVLGLRGALSESQLGMLRPLVSRLVDELSKELASRITPVLAGLASSRPSVRRTGKLDLPATIRCNLRHVAEVDGRRLVVPETPVFRSPVRKTSPWHIIVVVDVSPSMETSTIYAAVTASILSGIATYRLSLLTFDSEVMDLSEYADDPLSLLLEISPVVAPTSRKPSRWPRSRSPIRHGRPRSSSVTSRRVVRCLRWSAGYATWWSPGSGCWGVPRSLTGTPPPAVPTASPGSPTTSGWPASSQRWGCVSPRCHRCSWPGGSARFFADPRRAGAHMPIRNAGTSWSTTQGSACRVKTSSAVRPVFWPSAKVPSSSTR